MERRVRLHAFGNVQNIILAGWRCDSTWVWLLYTVEGFGQTGPYKKRGGYDAIATAIGGLLHITGPEVGLGHHS